MTGGGIGIGNAQWLHLRAAGRHGKGRVAEGSWRRWSHGGRGGWSPGRIDEPAKPHGEQFIDHSPSVFCGLKTHLEFASAWRAAGGAGAVPWALGWRKGSGNEFRIIRFHTHALSRSRCLSHRSDRHAEVCLRTLRSGRLLPRRTLRLVGRGDEGSSRSVCGGRRVNGRYCEVELRGEWEQENLIPLSSFLCPSLADERRAIIDT